MSRYQKPRRCLLPTGLIMFVFMLAHAAALFTQS